MRTPTQRIPARDDRVEHRTANGWTVVGITGEVDVWSAPGIREAVVRLIDEGRRHFVLDLGGVTFLDSMGLGMVVAITKRLRAHGGSLLLTCADPRILKVFRIGGLRTVYTFHPTPTEATRRPPKGDGLEGWPHVPA